MKKSVVWILVFCMMLGLCACGAPDSGQTQTTEPTETTVDPAKELLDGKKRQGRLRKYLT